MNNCFLVLSGSAVTNKDVCISRAYSRIEYKICLNWRVLWHKKMSLVQDTFWYVRHQSSPKAAFYESVWLWIIETHTKSWLRLNELWTSIALKPLSLNWITDQGARTMKYSDKSYFTKYYYHKTTKHDFYSLYAEKQDIYVYPNIFTTFP